MKDPHSVKYPRSIPAVKACRGALELGSLIKHGRHWICSIGGRRIFHARTVNQLIDNGEAVRIGDCIVKWRPSDVADN